MTTTPIADQLAAIKQGRVIEALHPDHVLVRIAAGWIDRSKAPPGDAWSSTGAVPLDIWACTACGAEVQLEDEFYDPAHTPPSAVSWLQAVHRHELLAVEPRPEEVERFEFTVEGVFDIQDRGTVLAGVVVSGEIAVGDPILLEDGQEVAVRGIEMQGMRRGPGTKLGLLIGNQHGSTVIRIGAHVVQP